MTQRFSKATFNPGMSPEEWEMILSALRAYRHNAHYRALLERLEYQTATMFRDRKAHALP